MSDTGGNSDPESRHDVFFSFHGSQKLYFEKGQVWNMRDSVVKKLASSELQRYWVTRNIGNLSIFYDNIDTKERLDEIWEGLLKTRGGGVVLYRDWNHCQAAERESVHKNACRRPGDRGQRRTCL
jgi:hypothetical protein